MIRKILYTQSLKIDGRGGILKKIMLLLLFAIVFSVYFVIASGENITTEIKNIEQSKDTFSENVSQLVITDMNKDVISFKRDILVYGIGNKDAYGNYPAYSTVFTLTVKNLLFVDLKELYVSELIPEDVTKNVEKEITFSIPPSEIKGNRVFWKINLSSRSSEKITYEINNRITSNILLDFTDPEITSPVVVSKEYKTITGYAYVSLFSTPYLVYALLTFIIVMDLIVIAYYHIKRKRFMALVEGAEVGKKRFVLLWIIAPLILVCAAIFVFLEQIKKFFLNLNATISQMGFYSHVLQFKTSALAVIMQNKFVIIVWFCILLNLGFLIAYIIKSSKSIKSIVQVEKKVEKFDRLIKQGKKHQARKIYNSLDSAYILSLLKLSEKERSKIKELLSDMNKKL